ncbi:hypothetical protein DMA11_14575 [Marinilabiliaceae bacterium JC017]|nr:hypothetical protein DMA11_14575 [Marinilabiliaceae bacterium JC017]
MKNFKVKVENGKADFFKELMKNLDFVEFEEVEAFHEPRIYPGANFEIRSQKAGASQISVPPGGIDISSEAGAAQSMDRLKEVLSKIDQMRDQSKKKE